MSENAKPELLPCPFCGAQPASAHIGGRGAVYCRNDECFRPRVNAVYRCDAIIQWNKRASTAREAALREAITKTLEENAGLADGEDCTLIHLKRAIGAR